MGSIREQIFARMGRKTCAGRREHHRCASRAELTASSTDRALVEYGWPRRMPRRGPFTVST
jgi:hypothetical protein